MQGDFGQTLLVETSQTPELLHPAKQPLCRRSLGVERFPLARVSLNARVHAKLAASHSLLGELMVDWPASSPALAPRVQCDDGESADVIMGKAVVLCGVVALVGQQVDRMYAVLVQQHGQVLGVSLIGRRHVQLNGEFIGSVRQYMGLITEEPLVVPVLVLLLAPASVGIRGPTALRPSSNVGTVYSHDLPKVGKLLLELDNSLLKDSLNKVFVASELGDEAAVSGFTRNCGGIKSARYAEGGVALEPAYEGCDSGDVQDVASKVAMPKGLYRIALAATVNLAFESFEEFAIVNGPEDSFQLGSDRCTGLTCRTPKFIIVGGHREDTTFLFGSGGGGACYTTVPVSFIAELYLA